MRLYTTQFLKYFVSWLFLCIVVHITVLVGFISLYCFHPLNSRYEDLSLEPEDTTRQLLDFLDLPWHTVMDTYIDSHTSREKIKMVRNRFTKKLEPRKNTYGTTKNSTATAFAWKQKLGLARTIEIQVGSLDSVTCSCSSP